MQPLLSSFQSFPPRRQVCKLYRGRYINEKCTVVNEEGKRVGRTYKQEKSQELRRTFLSRLRERVKGFRQRREKRRSCGTFQSQHWEMMSHPGKMGKGINTGKEGKLSQPGYCRKLERGSFAAQNTPSGLMRLWREDIPLKTLLTHTF